MTGPGQRLRGDDIVRTNIEHNVASVNIFHASIVESPSAGARPDRVKPPNARVTDLAPADHWHGAGASWTTRETYDKGAAYAPKNREPRFPNREAWRENREILAQDRGS
jgi:hypothetical protein